MEPRTNTPRTSPTELAQLGKEQTLGEAKFLGCQRFETPNAITTAVSSGSTTISGKTTTIATAIPRGQTTALTAATPGDTTTI